MNIHMDELARCVLAPEDIAEPRRREEFAPPDRQDEVVIGEIITRMRRLTFGGMLTLAAVSAPPNATDAEVVDAALRLHQWQPGSR